MRVAPKVTLTSEERSELARIVASRFKQRQIVAACSDGATGGRWSAKQRNCGSLRGRSHASRALAPALSGAPVGWYLNVTYRVAHHLEGRCRASGGIDHAKQAEAVTHWSTRSMAAELGVSAASVSRHWRKNGLKPHLVRGVSRFRAIPGLSRS